MQKPDMSSVKTGDANEFMDKVKQVMRSADKGEVLMPSHTVIAQP